ncbi:hypothetical protein QA597_10280 [Marinilabiliaceae bacterium ANBcel2]|nr:hypothetical protein [Marinilabiliaceae bacterium ANBcel2]
MGLSRKRSRVISAIFTIPCPIISSGPGIIAPEKEIINEVIE